MGVGRSRLSTDPPLRSLRAIRFVHGTPPAALEFDSVSVMKEQDPISWRCALSEYESQEESEGNILSLEWWVHILLDTRHRKFNFRR